MYSILKALNLDTLLRLRLALDKPELYHDIDQDIHDLYAYPERLQFTYPEEWRIFVRQQLAKRSIAETSLHSWLLHEAETITDAERDQLRALINSSAVDAAKAAQSDALSASSSGSATTSNSTSMSTSSSTQAAAQTSAQIPEKIPEQKAEQPLLLRLLADSQPRFNEALQVVQQVQQIAAADDVTAITPALKQQLQQLMDD
ncbi:MAG: hypothetical protein HRU21_12670 [Pseudomonadales bacterium]|nr:hypothetical protein [Pseudomonadales bacterium]